MAERIKHLVEIAKEARIPKKRAGYIEIAEFESSDLKKGYFCKACVYFLDVQGGKCAIVKSQGEDCNGRFSKVIAPFGYCSLWAPNRSMLKK
jgi:hypothetical protein